MTPVGTLDGPGLARVDAAGQVTPPGVRWSLDWWVGADDRWHFPSSESAVRQSLVSLAPVVETAMRVPSGDAIQRVYAVHAGDDLAVVEITNRSPLPFAVAFAVRLAKRVALDGNVAIVDGRPAVLFPRAPTVVDGNFLFPLPHTATLRAAVPLRRRSSSMTTQAIKALPPSDSVARGWRAQADRGMRLILPAGRMADAIEANRIRLLLHEHSRDRMVSRVRAVYGLAASRRLKPPGPADLVQFEAMVGESSPTFTWAGERSWLTFLTLARGLLVRETGSPTGLALLPEIPEAWLGHSIEVHDAPTAHGTISYALRWHGERPALLWDGAGVRVTAPGLDPSWSSDAPSGEALLAPLARA